MPLAYDWLTGNGVICDVDDLLKNRASTKYYSAGHCNTTVRMPCYINWTETKGGEGEEVINYN